MSTPIHVNRFLGIAPKVSKTLLRGEQAQIARNARLWSQALSPLNGFALGTQLAKSGSIQTLHRYADNTAWLAWTQDVNAVNGPIANDTLEKLYFTGTDKPRVTTNTLYNAGTPGTNVPPASWILGIPAPTDAPVASDNGAGNITGTATWVFTFVRKYSDGWVEESAPSPVSNALSLTARQASVTLPNGSITTADYGLTHKRLYRSTGGAFFFVTEVAIGTSPTDDNVATASLGDAIDTAADLPWPDGLLGMVELANKCLAGFKDNVVYISEPSKPHATRLLNQYPVGAHIIGLGVIGTTIVVITDSNPYIGRGVDPAAYSFKPTPGAFPCTSKRSIASSELGVFWSTTRGMALCDGVSVSLATEEFITREEWKEFKPTTIHGVVHDGRYYGWFQTDVDINGVKIGGGFILDRLEAAFLSQLGDYVYAAHSIHETDEMHVVRKNPNDENRNWTYQWDANAGNPLNFEWKSKVFITEGHENFAFAQVIADYGAGLTPEEIAAIEAQIAAIIAFNAGLAETDGPWNGSKLGTPWNGAKWNGDNQIITPPSSEFAPATLTFKYWADGVLRLTREVTSNEPFPLPDGFTAELHEFQLSGVVKVDQVTLAGSMEELGRI